MPHRERRVRFDELPWESIAPGLRQKRAAGVRLLEHRPEHVETEWCTRAHTGYVIEGELSIQYRDGSITYRAGDAVVIPGGDSAAHKGSVPLDGHALLFLVD